MLLFTVFTRRNYPLLRTHHLNARDVQQLWADEWRTVESSQVRVTHQLLPGVWLHLWFVNQGSWCLLPWQLHRQLICTKCVSDVSERRFLSAVNIDSLNKNRLWENMCVYQLEEKSSFATD